MINDLTQKMRNISNDFRMLATEFEQVTCELENTLYQLDGRIYCLEKKNEQENAIKAKMIELLKESMSDSSY